MIELFAPPFKNKGINLSYKIEDSIILKAEMSLINQLFNILLENALKYGKTFCEIELKKQGNKIYFTRQGGPYFSDDFIYVDNDMYLQSGKCVHEDKKDFNIDTDCVVNGNISITPLTMERTNLQIFEQLKNSIK